MNKEDKARDIKINLRLEIFKFIAVWAAIIGFCLAVWYYIFKFVFSFINFLG